MTPKRLYEIAGELAILPLLVAYHAGVISYRSAGQMLSFFPGLVGKTLRRGWYRRTLESCGERLTVEFGAVIHRPGTQVGHDCRIGEYNWIGLADIGDSFMSSSHVVIASGRQQHGFARRDIAMRRQPGKFEIVHIGDDVWVGAAATVTGDIPAHCIVASGAAVSGGIHEEWAILGGVPARKIGERP